LRGIAENIDSTPYMCLVSTTTNPTS